MVPVDLGRGQDGRSCLPVPARYRPSRVRRGTDGIRIVCGLSTSGTAAVVGQRDSGRVVFLPQWLGIPDDATGYVFVDGAPQPSLTVDLFGARVQVAGGVNLGDGWWYLRPGD